MIFNVEATREQVNFQKSMFNAWVMWAQQAWVMHGLNYLAKDCAAPNFWSQHYMYMYTCFQHQLWMFHIHMGYTYTAKIVLVEYFGCGSFELFSFAEHTMSWGCVHSHKSNRDRCSEGPSNEISTHGYWLVPFSHSVGCLFKTNLHNYRKEKFRMNMHKLIQ